MKQGASRHALKDRGPDLYETPACATEALLRVEALTNDIWEPAAGRGAIARVLANAGETVVASDLNAYDGADPGIHIADFFKTQRAPRGASCIVTNPPYKSADAFVRHGLTLVDEVFVLLRLMALEGARRSDLIDRHLWRVWAGIERLPMMHREGWKGPRISSAGAPFAWFVFKAKPRPDYEPIELRRMSWREAS
jgi:hypothetical protein